MKTRQKPSALVDTRLIYCGDNLFTLKQLPKLPPACVDLIYIEPPSLLKNSNRNYEVFWGETKEKRALQDRHETACAPIILHAPHCALI